MSDRAKLVMFIVLWVTSGAAVVYSLWFIRHIFHLRAAGHVSTMRAACLMCVPAFFLSVVAAGIIAHKFPFSPREIDDRGIVRTNSP